MYASESEFTVELDGSLAHPWAKDVVQIAARENWVWWKDQRGSIGREEVCRRASLWRWEPSLCASRPRTLWTVGVKASDLLKHLARRSTNENGHADSIEFKTCWMRRLLTALQNSLLE